MSLVNALAAGSIPIYNAQVPKEGPRAVVLPVLDFSQGSDFTADLQPLMDNSRISMVQTIYIDAALAVSPITVSIGSGPQIVQTITVLPNTQGFYPVVAPNPLVVQINAGDAQSKVRLIMMNVPVAPGSWKTA